MICIKTSFANEQYALEFIKRLQATSKRATKPTRAYLCTDCLNWHITSKKEIEKDNSERQIANLKKEIENKNLVIKDLLGMVNNNPSQGVQKYLKRYNHLR